MRPSRNAIAFLVLFFLVGSGLAQQRRDRRVFSNEDVERPAPAQPAVPPTTEEEAAPAETTQPAKPPESQPSGPQAELKRAMELQAIFRQALREYYEKVEKETAETRKERWVRMSDSLSALLRGNQEAINELQEQIKQIESAGTPSPAPQ